MKLEDRLLCLCTRQHFREEHQRRMLELCANTTVQWDYIYNTAHTYGVAAMIAENLLKCTAAGLKIPRNYVAQFMMYRAQSMTISNHKMQKLKEALAYFNERSIDVMLFKGAALNIDVYERPWYTHSEDIDIILRTQKEDMVGTSDEEIVRLFRPLIEHDFFEHHDMNLNGILPINFQNVWDHAVKIEYLGQDVYVMGPEDMLISVCINCSRKRFFYLKNICDVAEMVFKQKAIQIDWDTVIRKTKEYRCNNIVYTALLIAKRYFDAPVPDYIFKQLSVNIIKAAIIRTLVKHHSFTTLQGIYNGYKVFGRELTPAALLSGAAFRISQIWSKIKYVWKSRKDGGYYQLPPGVQNNRLPREILELANPKGSMEQT